MEEFDFSRALLIFRAIMLGLYSVVVVVSERFIRTLKNKIDKFMTLISKNLYIDKLDDLFNKCNNAYQRTVKMKSKIMLRQVHILTLVRKLMRKILKLKFVIVGEHQNIRTCSLRFKLEIEQKRFLSLKTSKILYHEHMPFVINPNNEENVGIFYRKKIAKFKSNKV